MKHPYDHLVLEGAAALIFTPCPGTKGASLQDSLQTLQQAGAAAIISLMPQQEMTQNAVDALPALCDELKLRWFHCPVEDDQAPLADFAAAWQLHSADIHQLLNDGKNIAIHCKGGSGRTGLIAAQIMLERGIDKAEVKQRIQALRPNALTLASHLRYFQSL